ncbi:Peptidase S28 - like 7 [Theobroma cacao]|nr:Peptidase S28 - like 7 [Theobroma cacao]
MEAQRLLLQSSQVLLLLPTVCLAAAYPDSVLPPEFVTYYYEQTLDHFNYKYASYLTCQQKYIVNSNSRGGANTSSPIFVYTGDKAWIDGVAISAGFIIDLASRFRGLLLYIEHRYYGDSMAFGYKQIAGQNASTLGFFSASQALADYAELIIELKRNLSEENCPVIAIGGSYGGSQSDNPPYNSVSDACNAIDGAPAGTDILGKVVRGFNASFFGSGGSCNNVIEIKPNNGSGWFWQTCTEIVMPIGHGENVTMFQASPFDLENYTRTCLEIFGVSPTPHWIITEFGGHDIKYVLGNFASNIIFSNGLRNPWSAGGVLQNISDSVVAVYTKEGAHCLDLSNPSSSDPDWLVAQRDKEINIIGSWIEDYKVKLGSKAGKKIHF